MPLEAFSPAVTPEWSAEFVYPWPVPQSGFPTSNYNPNDHQVRPWWQGAGTGTPANLGTAAAGGTGVTTRYAVVNGRMTLEFFSTGAQCSQSWFCPWWQLHGLQAGNPGYIEDQLDQVAWWRFGHKLSAVDATLGQGTGFVFTPYAGTGLGNTNLPGGAAFEGGVGIVCDGAGGLQYRSWGPASAVLETVPVPAAANPNVTLWSTYDFIFRAGNVTSAGWLTVRCNGTELVTQRAFGSAQLAAPTVLNPLAYTYGLNFGIRDPGSATRLRLWWHARFGRFTPDGVETFS